MRLISFTLFVLFVSISSYSATIYAYIHNVSGSTVSGATVVLRKPNGSTVTATTNSSGLATFALLDYGTYSYEVYYSGETSEFWGNIDNISLYSPTTTSNFYRDWPYRYSYSISSSNVNTGQNVSIQVTVKNKLSFSRSTKVELWVDRNQVSSYDFHTLSSAQTISGNGTKTYSFTINPSNAGTYYWKIRVLTYNNGAGTYIPTDSYYWATAFTAADPAGDLDVYVKNVNNSYVSNAKVKLYTSSWNLVGIDYTNSSGRADFDDVNYGTYNYEVYYTGDVEEFWGSDEGFSVSSLNVQRTFVRNWPFRYSYNAPLTGLTSQPLNFQITVKNYLSYSRPVKIELWIDKNKSTPWDYNQVTSAQTIAGNSQSTFNISFTPAISGEYFWKIHVLTYNDGSGQYLVTDSYGWPTSVISISDPVGNLSVLVKNSNNNIVENAQVRLYSPSGSPVNTQTNSSGIATFNSLAYGTYSYEVRYTWDTVEFWGSDENFSITAPSTLRNFVRDWPYRDLHTLAQNCYLGQSIAGQLVIQNDLSYARNVKVEYWADRNNLPPWDIHATTISYPIGANSQITIPILFNPQEVGNYYWKMRVLTYNDGSNTFIPTDSYSWANAFSVSSLNATLNVTVNNVNGNPVEGAIVKLFKDNFGNLIQSQTSDGSGVASFGVPIVGTYMYEVYAEGDTTEFWGNSDNIIINGSGTYPSTFNRKWPYSTEHYSSEDNTTSGYPLIYTVKVKNKILNANKDVIVELWLDRDKVAPYDYHLILGPETVYPLIVENFEVTISPSDLGTYYSKARIKTFNYGSSQYVITDSYLWDSAFTVSSFEATLNVTVHNANGNIVNGATVKLFKDNYGNLIQTGITQGNGLAIFTIEESGTYMYEVYSEGDTTEFWGNEGSINITDPIVISKSFDREWPFLSSHDFSDCNPFIDQAVSINLGVTNKIPFFKDVMVELWIDRDQVPPYDFHILFPSKQVNILWERDFDTLIKASTSGLFFWKARIKTFNYGSNTYVITDSYLWDTAFTASVGAPIGRYVYHAYSEYMADPQPGDNIDGNLFLYNNQTNLYQNVTQGLPVKKVMNAHFSTDGSRLTFMACPDTCTCSSTNGRQSLEIFNLNLANNSLIRLTYNNIPDEDPKFSPDGKYIIFKRSDQIYRMKSDGSEVIQLTSGGEKSGPNYSPNGLYVTYWSLSGASASIWIMNNDGSNQHLIADSPLIEDMYPVFINNDSIAYFRWISSTDFNTYINIYSISQNNSYPLNIQGYNPAYNYADPFPINSEYIGISCSPLPQAAGLNDYCDIAIVNYATGHLIIPSQMATEYWDIGGWYSPLLTARSLTLVHPFNDTSILNGNTLQIEVVANEEGGIWSNASIECIISNGTYKYTYSGFNDNGINSDAIAGDGKYSNSIVLPTDTGIYTLKLTSSYTENGHNNHIISDSIKLVLFDLPTVIIDPLSDLCIDHSPINLSGSVQGVYSGPGVAGNMFYPNFAGPGLHIIALTYTDTYGNVGSDSTTIEVFDLPSVEIDPISNVCVNHSTVTLSGNVMGTYSGIGVIGNSFYPAAAGVGQHNISLTYTDGNGCVSSDTFTIEVFDLPYVSIDSLSSVCLDESSVSLSGSVSGTFSGFGVTGNTFVPNAAGSGQFIITLTYVDGNGCQNSDSTFIEVFDLPLVIIDSVPYACINGGPVYLIGNLPGIFDGPGVLWNTFYPSLAGQGIHAVTLSYTDSNGCVNIDTTYIEVIDPIIIGFPAPTYVCIDDPAMILSTDPNDIFYGPGVIGDTFYPALAGSGLHYIAFQYLEEHGCEVTMTLPFIVNPLPLVEIIGDTTLCAGDSGILQAYTLSTGNMTFAWSPGNETSNAISLNSLAAGVHKYSVSLIDENGCSNDDSIVVKVYNRPLFNLPDTVWDCYQALSTLSADSGYASYLWSTGESSSNIQSSIPGNYSLTITDNGCTAIKDIVLINTQRIVPDTLSYLNNSVTIAVIPELPSSSYQWSYGLSGNPVILFPVTDSLVYVTITNPSATCIDSVFLLAVDSMESNVRVRVFLQGASQSSDNMKTQLNNLCLIPVLQPYNNPPWDYAGLEQLDTIPGNMTDWVLVALRSSVDTVVSRRAGILLSDGTIIDTNGAPYLAYFIQPGEYYISVQHRNHLPVMSSEKVVVPNLSFFDFTDTLYFPVYGNCIATIQNGYTAMIPGDINQDGILKYSGPGNDRVLILQRILNETCLATITATTSGYYSEDLNMDGIVKYSGPGNDPSLIIQSIVQYTGSTAINSTVSGCAPEPVLALFPGPWKCGDTLIDDRDGQTYATVQIGGQCWMAENLSIGMMVNSIHTGSIHTDVSNNGIVEKYCYNNDPANCAIYGGLYDWNEMMNYSTTPGTQGICPPGWHIPSEAEWCTLTTYLDSSMNCAIGGSGTTTGGKMKESGFDHWNTPNTGATNSTGFSALGAGYRENNGSFGALKIYAYFWPSTESNSEHGHAWSIDSYSADIYRSSNSKANGFSIRCLKD